jgi:pyruvate/2-oxoglutarate dehydrogenase complex dihydrolipoamide acyltransferase (E2) component
MSSSATRSSTAVEVVMPQMGVSVAEGTVVEWRKRPGDPVAADEPVCDVTTDKIDVEIPAPADGVMARVLVEEGETVAVGTLLAELEPAGARATVGGEEAAAADLPTVDEGGEDGELDRSAFVSPVVRRIADEHGVDVGAVDGHGVGGRVRKADLLAFIERQRVPAMGGTRRRSMVGSEGTPRNGNGRTLHSDSPYRPEPEPAASPATADGLIGPTSREPLSPMRQAIARHMLASRSTSAHCTTMVEADFSAAAARRRELEGRPHRPTYLAFVARAVVAALGRHPILNASIEGEEIVHHEDVNLGIAVALNDGLVVPVIRRAQRLSTAGLAEEIALLARRARDGELLPDDVHGGTFTITNPGQFGALLATPIINQPQVGILDVEAVVDRPVAVADGSGGKAIAIRPMGYLCMSWDHRALDGAEAARFLADVRAGVERGEL